jgi:hypothetical protein
MKNLIICSIFFGISTLNLPAFAYIVGNTLIIENETGKDLVLDMNGPDKGPISRTLKLGKSSFYTENNDHTGWYGSWAPPLVSPFRITNDGKTVIFGRVGYYIAGPKTRHSFLDSNVRRVGEGTEAEFIYDCQKEGSENPQSKIIIKKVSDKEPSLNFTDKEQNFVQCNGLKWAQVEYHSDGSFAGPKELLNWHELDKKWIYFIQCSNRHRAPWSKNEEFWSMAALNYGVPPKGKSYWRELGGNGDWTTTNSKDANELNAEMGHKFCNSLLELPAVSDDALKSPTGQNL